MKDSTLYKILGVIILIFFIFLAWKVFIFPKKVQASANNGTVVEPVENVENDIENQIENEIKNEIENQIGNEILNNQVNQNNITNVTDEANVTDNTNQIDSESTNVFNSQLDQYKGTHKGSEVRSMLESVRNSNLIEDEHRITIQFQGENYVGDVYALKEKVEALKNYEISFEYEKDTKYIQKIVIEQVD